MRLGPQVMHDVEKKTKQARISQAVDLRSMKLPPRDRIFVPPRNMSSTGPSCQDSVNTGGGRQARVITGVEEELEVPDPGVRVRADLRRGRGG
jgi:hypothetical protein